MKIGNNAEKQGAKIPNWDAIKNADSNQIKDTLHAVKKERDQNQVKIDQLYTEACSKIVEATNTEGVEQSKIQTDMATFCQRLTANAGDQIIDIQLAQAILWKVAEFVNDKKIDAKKDSETITQFGISLNGDFIKSFGDMKTRCWQQNADCSPSSVALRNQKFMTLYNNVMQQSWNSVKEKNKKASQSASVDLDSFTGRLLVASDAQGRTLKALYQEGRQLFFKRKRRGNNSGGNVFKNVAQKVQAAKNSVGGAIQKVANKAKEVAKNTGNAVKKAVNNVQQKAKDLGNKVKRAIAPPKPVTKNPTQAPSQVSFRTFLDNPQATFSPRLPRPRVVPPSPISNPRVTAAPALRNRTPTPTATSQRAPVTPTTSRSPTNPAASKTFAKLPPIKQQRVIQQAVKDVNRVITSLDVKTLFGKSKINNNQNKTEAELRTVLFEGVQANLEPAKERCEKKFGKGKCMKFGDYSFVYACSGLQLPQWVDSTMKRFKCVIPGSEDKLDDASTFSSEDLLGLNQVYEAFYYEVLDA